MPNGVVCQTRYITEVKQSSYTEAANRTKALSRHKTAVLFKPVHSHGVEHSHQGCKAEADGKHGLHSHLQCKTRSGSSFKIEKTNHKAHQEVKRQMIGQCSTLCIIFIQTKSSKCIAVNTNLTIDRSLLLFFSFSSCLSVTEHRWNE